MRQDIFNTNPNADNISKVKSQIDNVKDVMVSNIDRVLERGEKIELLVDKTDKLNQQAFKFEKSVSLIRFSVLSLLCCICCGVVSGLADICPFLLFSPKPSRAQCCARKLKLTL